MAFSSFNKRSTFHIYYGVFFENNQTIRPITYFTFLSPNAKPKTVTTINETTKTPILFI